MTRILVDTQAFILAVNDAPALSPAARAILDDAGVVKLLSFASVWEMAIKLGLKKLRFPQPLEQIVAGLVADGRLGLLEIRPPHLYAVEHLPSHHRDPFDRLIVAQCLTENLEIVGRDAQFDAYGVRRVW